MDKWLSHPTALKIISIIVGLLLWAIVHIDPNTTPQTVTSSIDTKIIEAAKIISVGLDEKKYALTAMEPTVVRIVVQGRITDLLAAASINDYVVRVDLKDVRPGIQELPLDYSLPKGIKLVEMSPSTVTVQVEEIVTKSFEVQVTALGKPAEGFVAGTPTIVGDSNSVEITLPKDDMARVALVATEVNIEGADKTVVNKKAKVILYDSQGIEITNAAISPETVHVEVKVTHPFKTLPLQLRYSGTLPEGLSLVSAKPNISEVTVFGIQAALNELQVYDGAVLDLSKIKESGSVQVKAQLLDGIKSVEPAEITVDVVISSNTTRTLTGLTIDINGLSEGQTAVIQEPVGGKLNLTLSGADSVLSALKADQVSVIANVEGLDAGVHTLPLEIVLPAFVQTVLPNGQALTVKIEIVDNITALPDDEPSTEAGTTPSEPPASETLPPDKTGNENGNAAASSVRNRSRA